MSITTETLIDIFERSDLDKFQQLGGLNAFAQEFETDLENGLPESEARSGYANRRNKYGRNVLPDPEQDSYCKLFFDCFEDLMLRILLACAVVSLILSLVFPPSGKIQFLDFVDTISIFAAVLIVSFVQTQTNFSQQKQFLEITKLKNEFPINVIRGGAETQIMNTDLLVGDVLSLKNGDRVAADGVFIKGHQLKINNSQETGESCAVSVSSEHPFVLGGGAVESGDAHLLICAVGERSQSGVTMMQIQKMEEDQEKSPLEKKLDRVAILLTYIGLAGSVLTFVVLLIFWIVLIVKNGWKNTMISDLVKRFMIGVTIFICAVPEGLPLAVTLSLGFSMKKMMKDQNFVRHLQACETMGGATTICSDKTGTLTQNKMTVVRYYQDGHDYEEKVPELQAEIKELLSEAVAVNSSAYMSVDDEGSHFVGSSSECALLQFIENFGADYKQIRHQNPIVVLHEFNSERKRMSTIIAKNEGYRIYTKGAPDFVLSLCTKYMRADGTIADLDQATRDSFFLYLGQYADMSLRTMLVAFADLPDPQQQISEWENPKTVEQDLIAVGFVGIQDPLRPEVIQAIEHCKTARVQVRMVTGDYINTAKAIAKQCGILTDDGIAIEGKEFSSKSKLDLIDIVPRLQVMARSSPRDKYRLVSLLMEMGEVVAVTGDGSNDSPALKKANVGLSMGKCGTELAKMASDIVILDDNFNSIVSALKWGRCVYDNVRGFLQFQLTVNFSAMIIAFLGSCVLHESPLKTIQLLWVNLIMDSLGALALATRAPSESLLHRPPYGESDSLINNILTRNIIGQVSYQIVVLIIVLFGGVKILKCEEGHISTLVFNVFVYMQVFNLINSRCAGHESNVLDGLFSNVYFLGIFAGIFVIQFLLVLVGGSAFQTEHLNAKEWFISFGFGAGSLLVGFLLRLITLKDNTIEKLDALREERKSQMRHKYSGMSYDDQWAFDFTPKKEEDEKEVNIESPLIVSSQEK